MKPIVLTVNRFEKYQVRKDIKQPYWFAMSNRFFLDPDFFAFDSDEKCVWWFILAQASYNQNKIIEVIPEVFFRQTGIKLEALFSALEKLQNKKIINTNLDDLYAIRTESVRDPYVIREQSGEIRTAQYNTTTIQYNTKQSLEHLQNASAFLPDNKKPKSKKVSDSEATAKRVSIRQAFLESYQQEFQCDYPSSFSGKEYKQIDNWLKSVSLDRALEYCQMWPKWNDPWVTERGHTFSLLVSKYIELDAWLKRSPQLLEKIAIGRATKNAQLTGIQRLAEMKAYAAMDSQPNSTNLVGVGETLPLSAPDRIPKQSIEGNREEENYPNEFDEGYASSF